MLKETVKYSLFSCTQYLFQIPVKGSFVSVMLFRNCSSFQLSIATRIYSSPIMVVFSYFLLVQRNVDF